MDRFAVTLILASAMLHAFREYLTKKGGDKQLFIYWYRLIALVLFFPIFLLNLDMEIPPAGWAFILASGAVHVLYYYTLAEAYDQGDLSLVYPIARSAPIFILLWASLVWGDPMSSFGIIGIFTVVLGAYVLQLRGLTWKQIAAPVLAAVHDRSIRMAWATTILVAAYSLIDDRGVERVEPILYLYIFSALSFLLYIPYICRSRRGRILAEWRTHRVAIVLAGAVSLLGYLLALEALRIERVGYVTAVRQVSIVFGVIMGSFLLREPYGPSRLFASLVMFAGMALIVGFG